MANVPSEADRLRKAGRYKILRTCLLFGGPLLGILVAAGLQGAGAIHLEEYLAVPPNKVEQRVVWKQFSDAIGGLLGGTRPRESPA